MRKAMLSSSYRAESRQSRSQEIMQWIEENPDVKKKVKRKVHNVPESQREQAKVNVGRKMLEDQGLR